MRATPCVLWRLHPADWALCGEWNQRLRTADRSLSFGSVLFDSLEAVRSDGKTSGSYDILGYFGRDYNKFVLKAEGEVANGKLQEARTGHCGAMASLRSGMPSLVCVMTVASAPIVLGWPWAYKGLPLTGLK